MWVLALEAALALGLFIFLIWWTIPGKKSRQVEQADKNDEKK